MVDPALVAEPNKAGVSQRIRVIGAAHAFAAASRVPNANLPLSSFATEAPMRDYAEHDGLGLAALVRKGETTPAELLEAAIEKLRKSSSGDSHGPQ